MQLYMLTLTYFDLTYCHGDIDRLARFGSSNFAIPNLVSSESPVLSKSVGLWYWYRESQSLSLFAGYSTISTVVFFSGGHFQYDNGALDHHVWVSAGICPSDVTMYDRRLVLRI